jgi:hypothetical protein
MKSEEYPPEQPYTPVAEIVAMADEVADLEVDEEMDARNSNSHAAKWTIIPPMSAEREITMNMIQTPPGTPNEVATSAVSQDTSSLTASTSRVPQINAAMSTKAQHRHRLLQKEIVT